MKKNSLSEQGLSISQAQSVSNVCNQRALEIENKISPINNYSKTININNGEGFTTYVQVEGNKMPDNIVEMLENKGKLHACQAFLMENISIKSDMLDNKKRESFIFEQERPKEPVYKKVVIDELEDSTWGWEQLSANENNEYLEAEAMASHLGQFIHKDGKLSILRREIPSIPSLEWFEVMAGEKTPVLINKHHTSEFLLELHEKFAKKHRYYEQRVNYFKSKVKNLVSEKNSLIEKENSIKISEIQQHNESIRLEYETQFKKWNTEYSIKQKQFESEKHEEISKISKLRIKVDSRFKDIIDEILSEIETK